MQLPLEKTEMVVQIDIYTELSKLIIKGTGEVVKCHLYGVKEFKQNEIVLFCTFSSPELLQTAKVLLFPICGTLAISGVHFS